MQKAIDALLVAMLVSAGAVALSAQSPAPEARAREPPTTRRDQYDTLGGQHHHRGRCDGASRLRGAGFTDVRLLQPVPRKGNLVVRYPGNGTSGRSSCSLISTWSRRRGRTGRSIPSS